MEIGHWVRRQKLYTWHRIESVVADDAITRCGRRMRNEPTKTGGSLVTAPRASDQWSLCFRCA